MTTLADKIAPYAAQFRRDGFVMVPDLLDADELERYGAAVDEAVARRKRFDNRTARREDALRTVVHPMHQSVGRHARGSTAHVSSDRMRDGGAPARRRHASAVARSGAVQRSGRAADRSASGSAVLADGRDRHDHGVDSVRRLVARDRMHGLRAGLARGRAASVREHLQARRRARNSEDAARSRTRRRCGSRCRAAESRSITG